MRKTVRIGLASLCAIAALVVAPVAVQAANPPHYYVNGLGSGARAAEGELIPVVSWGTQSFTNTAGGTGGKYACHIVAAGFVENPGEGPTGAAGIGETQSFDPYACEGKVCTAAATGGGPATYISVAAEPTVFVLPTKPGGNGTNLGWKSHLFFEEATKLFRSESEGVKLNVHCHVETRANAKTGEPEFGIVTNEISEGALRPSSGPVRLTASNPPFLEFDSIGKGSGELHGPPPSEETRLGKSEGELRILGYNDQDVVNVKNG
jgi:hypothetical protein